MLVAEALRIFYDMRKVPGLKKKPSTSELLDWLKLLLVEDIDESVLRERDPSKLIPLAFEALETGRVLDPFFVEPIYMRRSAAEDQWERLGR